MLQGVLCEVIPAIGNFLSGFFFGGVSCFLRIPVHMLLHRQCLGLRSVVSELPPNELTTILLQSILGNGVGCMTSIMFLLFETLSCYLEEEEKLMCYNTGMCAVLLSIFVILATTTSIISNVLPNSLKSEINREGTARELRFKQKGVATMRVLCRSLDDISLSIELPRNT